MSKAEEDHAAAFRPGRLVNDVGLGWERTYKRECPDCGVTIRLCEACATDTSK